MKKTANLHSRSYINTNALIIAVAIVIAGVSISTVFAQSPKSDSGGAVPIKASSFYIKTEGPFTVEPFTPVSITHSCDEGDIAVGGGMSQYDLNGQEWRTIQSSPSEDTAKWTTTVMYETYNTPTFRTVTKCIDIAPFRK